jgi:hypothetical protein
MSIGKAYEDRPVAQPHQGFAYYAGGGIFSSGQPEPTVEEPESDIFPAVVDVTPEPEEDDEPDQFEESVDEDEEDETEED